MYICNDCGAEFESPKLQMERIGEYWGQPAWEPWGSCPGCGSDDIEMESTCPMCGEEYKPNDKRYCDTCFTVVSEAFRKTINELAKDWKFKKENIKEVLYDLIDDDVL